MARFRVSALLALLLMLALVFGASRSSSQSGFQSINCGGNGFTDANTSIVWEEDPFIKYSSGLYGRVSKVHGSLENITSVFNTLRFFPIDKRNKKFCYSFEVSIGTTYLVRASFLYGNYDGRSQPPTFVLLLNYDIWTNVNASSSTTPIRHEITFVSNQHILNVCLAPNLHTNFTPFISTLELRTLEMTMYIKSTSVEFPSALSQGHGLMLWRRINYGAITNATIRYPYDKYDRIWEANTTGPTVRINTTKVSIDYLDDQEKPPAEVLATAITSNSSTGNLSLLYEEYGGGYAGFRMEMHFEELDETAAGQSPARAFGFAIPRSSLIFTDLTQQIFPIAPPLDGPDLVFFDATLDLPVPFQMILYPYPGSLRGPLLNAVELFRWTSKPLYISGTFQGDVDALMNIQKHFNITGYGQGDPCMPKGYEWVWIACNGESTPRITKIDLASLDLTGDIPVFINDLTSLIKVDLSHNMLTGQIPPLNKLHDLIYLDVSYNNLCGSSPSFSKRVDYRHVGNIGLCEYGSNCDCNSSLYLDNPIQKCKSKKKYIFAISFMGALYIVFLVIFLVLFKSQQIKRREKNATLATRANKTGVDDLKGLPYIAKMFTYKEMSNATLNFTTLLGQGGFGKVYHGLLPTGEAIAVKLLEDASKQGLKEFYNEVAILSRLRHKNLVCLLGYCVENTHMLIYEYVAKGNLRDLIYGDVESTDKPLPWKTRLQIALDASRGLEYLHFGCDPVVIHRDVKSSNILLSEKMQAKVADFGLSRLKEGDTTISHVSTINVVGTPGYLDPAYNATNQLTDKSDVYSFGIVLLELICGRAPINTLIMPPHIVDWASTSIMQGKVEEIVDPMLGNEYKVDSMWKVIDVAFGCVDDDRVKRPKMSQVSQVLQSALEVEIDECSQMSSKDSSDSSMTSEGKIPNLQYIKNNQIKLQPR